MKTAGKVTLVAGLLGAGIALAAMNPLRNPKIAQELGLSQEQVQKLEDLRYQNQKQMVDIRRDLQLKMLDIRREMGKDNPDPQVLDRLVDEAAAIRARQQKTRIHHLLDVKKVLTPEQWAKGRQMLMDRREGMRERFGARPGAGGRGMRPGPGMGRGQGQPPEGPQADGPARE
jgi:Spy/CpxP family protein refolding chaperone